MTTSRPVGFLLKGALYSLKNNVFCNKKVQKNAMKNAEFCHPI